MLACFEQGFMLLIISSVCIFYIGTPGIPVKLLHEATGMKITVEVCEIIIVIIPLQFLLIQTPVIEILYFILLNVISHFSMDPLFLCFLKR